VASFERRLVLGGDRDDVGSIGGKRGGVRLWRATNVQVAPSSSLRATAPVPVSA
jgi:hypothetical protein